MSDSVPPRVSLIYLERVAILHLADITLNRTTSPPEMLQCAAIGDRLVAESSLMVNGDTKTLCHLFLVSAASCIQKLRNKSGTLSMLQANHYPKEVVFRY